MLMGSTRMKSARAWPGIRTRGRMAASAPGRRAPVSGSTAMAAATATKISAMSQNTRPSCWRHSCANSPATTMPAAMPTMGAMVLTSVPRSRCRSSSAAPMAALAMPVAKPCSTRASTRACTSPARANTASETISSTSAARITGLRPRWSDSAPVVSRASSRLSA